jgi:sugar phosphate permease
VRARVFALTWISYASYYLTRKNFSVTKSSIQDSLGISQGMLGAIDVVYLTAYSIGQFVWGPIADRVGARRVIAAGMLASAVLCAAFGFASTGLLFGILWALNGLAQSTGWPANLKAITPWFQAERRGTVMGFWSTCYQFGSWVANPIAVAFIGVAALAWRGAFVFPAIIVAAVGVVVFLFLPEKRVPIDEAERARFHEEVKRERGRVLRTPLVWALGAAYFYMKLIRYVLFFWLPYYMRRELGYSVELAGIAPNAFEIGGLLGAITAGFVSDRLFRGRRVEVGVISLVLLALAMPLYAFLVELGLGYNLLGLAFVGFCLFGPDTLLSATAAQDLGGPAAAATAAGVINGLGSVGPIIGLALAPWMSQKLGWSVYFSSLGIGAFIGALILIPFLRRGRGATR